LALTPALRQRRLGLEKANPREAEDWVAAGLAVESALFPGLAIVMPRV